MPSDERPDYYEALQISPNAEPDTIHRVYRLLAQQSHPDNTESGNVDRFRLLNEAYQTLSDPERRAQYDVFHARQRQDRWRFVAAGAEADSDIDNEQRIRLTVLEVLYTHKRTEPESAGLSPIELERLTGRPREHLTFTLWYLGQKKYVGRADNSQLVISADGIDYLEKNYRENVQRRRLTAGDAAASDNGKGKS